MHTAIDTEFNEFGGELISIGLVREDGKEEYFEVEPPAVWKPWVRRNVVPLLTGPRVNNGERITRLRAFFHDDEWPSIIVDHPADIRYFCELLNLNLGNYIGTDKGWQFTVMPKLGQGFPSEVPHHALHDARALMKAFLHSRETN